MFYMNFNEFVQYSFTIQPTTTSPPRADLEGDMWVWTLPPPRKIQIAYVVELPTIALGRPLET